MALSPEERLAHANPNKVCIEDGCLVAAGTPWSPYWCADHDDARIERISRQFQEIQTAFAQRDHHGCDLDRCCSTCRRHTTPHKGCILR